MTRLICSASVFLFVQVLAAQEKVPADAPAALTLYAKEPDKVKHLKDRDTDAKIPHYILLGEHTDMTGHSFWRCTITDDRSLTAAEKRLNGHCFGLYPRGGLASPYHAVSIVDGILGTDDHHSVSASITCPIDEQTARRIFAETEKTGRSPQLWYHLTNGTFSDHKISGRTAQNCTGLCAEISRIADAPALDGTGVAGAVLQENDMKTYIRPFPFANPFHHSRQIRQQKQRPQ
ncbi:MAG: hypothetical protein LBH00_10355 [Planctomycetaceae bacterium]|jgi:hypothetical protein|nr:hypothetical protein [Planctomycetaceae bacterium]